MHERCVLIYENAPRKSSYLRHLFGSSSDGQNEFAAEHCVLFVRVGVASSASRYVVVP